jgi:hypothetical protein
MKFHALAEPSRVETMEVAASEKSHFMRFSENLDMFPLTNGLEADEAKSGYIQMKSAGFVPASAERR